MVSPRLCAVLQCIADYRRGADLRIGALLERRAIGRRVSVSAASNRVARSVKLGVGPFQRNCAMSSKSTMLVRSVASSSYASSYTELVHQGSQLILPSAITDIS